MDMHDLLADNIALINQLSSLSGLVSLPQATVHQTRIREIPSLASWLYCFIAFIAVRTIPVDSPDAGVLEVDHPRGIVPWWVGMDGV